MSLDDDPQWFTCVDGSYTPWRHGCQEPGPNADWMDVSRYQPHPGSDYDRIEPVEVEPLNIEDLEEYYKEDEFEAAPGDGTQEDIDEGYFTDEGDYLEGEDEYVGPDDRREIINTDALLS